jgi:peptidoglycan/xylan/chitin deacetylase (PgdA/CDA1 family)
MARGFLKAMKHAVLRGAAASGLQRFVRDSAWRRRRLLILCYHGVSLADEHEWSSLYVTPDHLAARLRLLRDSGCNILSLDDGLRKLYAGDLPPRSVAVTFDDGFVDFHLKAEPLLREYSVPSVVYLTTYYTTDQRPVFDPLAAYLLWKGQGLALTLPGIFDGTIEIPRDPALREAVHGRIRGHANSAGWSAEEKDNLATEISRQIGFDLDALRQRRLFYLMCRQELASLDPALIDVQLHTHRHRTPRDETLFTRELIDNRDAIRQLMPSRPHPVHFCYPSGDYDLAFLPWLRRQGVVSATTCDTGIASPEDDPLLLPRFIDTMHVPRLVFEGWLDGTASLLPRRTARAG